MSGPLLDHIAVACTVLEDVLPLYTEGLGLRLLGVEAVPTEGVRVAMLDLGGGARLELLEPTTETASIMGFLARRGPGLHHIALRVADIEAALAQAQAAGLEIIPPAPRPGAGGSRVAFVHPKTLQGVLLELVQPGAGVHGDAPPAGPAAGGTL
ncbi:MAG: methylmalonyl-CoA epimerase [Firmicutes bacterium]|nr:methylmalonyl-CoA epimerase [Bacillota bacterium]